MSSQIVVSVGHRQQPLRQRPSAYGVKDHSVWTALYCRRFATLLTDAAIPVLSGIEYLDLGPSRIPNFRHLNRRLVPRTGWAVVPGSHTVLRPILPEVSVGVVCRARWLFGRRPRSNTRLRLTSLRIWSGGFRCLLRCGMPGSSSDSARFPWQRNRRRPGRACGAVRVHGHVWLDPRGRSHQSLRQRTGTVGGFEPARAGNGLRSSAIQPCRGTGDPGAGRSATRGAFRARRLRSAARCGRLPGVVRLTSRSASGCAQGAPG